MLPIKLTIENFMSHSYSCIDFTKFNSALLIGSYNGEMDVSNGSGKSSVISSIEWVLFDKSRHKKKDGVVKKDKRSCKVEFLFEVDNVQYKITRRRDKIIGEADVIFEQFDGSLWKNISSDTNTSTDEKIVEVIKVNHDIFINSVYFRQNDISIFAGSNASSRKDIIKSLLKIDKWDEYQKEARAAVKTLTTKIEEKKRQITDIDFDTETEALEEKIEKIKVELEKQNQEHQKVNGGLISKTSAHQLMLSNLSAAPEQLKKLQKEYAENKKRVGQINQKVEENNKIISTNETQLTDLQQKATTINQKIKAKKELNEPVADFNARLVAAKEREKALKKEVQHAQKDLELGEVCPTCDKKLTQTDLKELKQNREIKLAELQNKLEKLTAQISKGQEKLNQIRVIDEEGTKAEELKVKLDLKLTKLKATINTAQVESNQLLEELKRASKRDYDKEINELKNSFDKEAFDKLEAEIATLKETYTNLKTATDQLNVELGTKVKGKEELQNQQANQIKLKAELKEVSDDFVVYEKLTKYFGKDGIQAVIIDNVIEELENYTNEILTKICNEPTKITIKTQKQNNNGAWVETFDLEMNIGGRADDFEALSGGEQFRCSLALRMSLSKILSKRMGGNLKFLLLDEVSSSLDKKGLDMFVEVVKQISNEMKVLIITHDEKLKEQFDDIIVVNKTAEGSRASN